MAVVASLLVIVGIASGGHPLTAGRSSSRATVALMAGFAAVAAVLLAAYALESRRPGSTARRPWSLFDLVLALAVVAGMTAGAYGIGRLGSSGSRTSGPGIPCSRFRNADCRAPVVRQKKPRHRTATSGAPGEKCIVEAV